MLERETYKKTRLKIQIWWELYTHSIQLYHHDRHFKKKELNKKGVELLQSARTYSQWVFVSTAAASEANA